MDRRYCNRICTEIMNWADYDNTNKQTGVGHYEKSAREIKAELYNNYFLKDKIDIVEYYYIFGKICADALLVGGEDFFRM